MRDRFGRIGVLLGGPSSEREISIKSGTAVYEALRQSGLDVVCIDPSNTSSINEDIKKAHIDVAFIALHGKFGEDGTIQRILEDMEMPYTGSGPESSRLALNKALSKKIFSDNGIPIPRYLVLKRPAEGTLVLATFSFPLVVKPACEGSSIGLSIVDEQRQLLPALELAFSYDEEVLVEEYIPGEDITVGIFDDAPLPAVHIVPKAKFYSYEAKYTAGMTDYIVPADIPEEATEEAQSLATLAHHILGCRFFSRVDMRFDPEDGKIIVLELNSIPGLTSISLLPKAAQAAGISFSQLCIRMVESAFIKV